MKIRSIALRLAAIGSLTYSILLVLSVVYLTTPRRLARLIAELCRPEPGMSCYDPCCGSGRLPRAVQSAARRSSGDRIRIFAQEINPISFVAASINRKLHGLDMTLKLGSTLRHPAFVDANGGLQRCDLAVATPPWNQSVPEAVYRTDRFQRFLYGRPSRDGDWAWMQHILAHLEVSGRMVVMLDHEAMSRSEEPAEVEVRQRFVESDLIEAVILCPWETSRPRWLARSVGDGHFVLKSDHKPRVGNSIIGRSQAVLIVVNRAKRRPSEILFMDTRPLVSDYLAGDLTADAVQDAITGALNNWTTVPGVSEVVSNADVAKSGFTLAPELHCRGHIL
jgi:type I restriction enzyme M protein